MKSNATYSALQRRMSRLFMLVLALLVLAGCDTGPAESLYDPDRASLPDPVIEAVDPSDTALAGVDVMTITGQNFSDMPANNLVYFDDVKAEVLEASAGQLRVLPPNEPRPGLQLRVAVVGAENFSNAITYNLEAASFRFSDVKGFEEVFGITTDADGNAFFSLFSDGRSAGIKRATPDGERSDYISSTFKWDDLAIGPDGAMYAVRGVRALFRFAGAGATQETWVVLENRSASITTIDFDEDGFLWAGGDNENLYRIAPDLSATEIPFNVNVRAVKVYEGHLYVVGDDNGAFSVWRFSLTNGELGPLEEIFAFTGQAGAGIEALSLAFAANGDLFIGTDAADPVMLVHAADGTWEWLYPGILQPRATGLEWGAGANLYMVQGAAGELAADMIAINTRRARGQ